MLSYTLFIANAVYKSVTLFLVLFPPKLEDHPVHQLVIHGELAAVSAMIVHWYHILYVKNTGLYATLVKITLRGKVLEDGRSQSMCGYAQ